MHPDTSPEEALRRRVQDIRAAFLKTVPERLARIEAAAASRAGADDLVREAHTLVGSAGTFGLPGVSEAARLLEEVAIAWRLGEEGAAEMVARRVEGLRAATLLSETLRPTDLPPIAPARAVDGRQEAVVYLLEDDGDQAAELALQLAPYGYVVARYPDGAGFIQAVRQGRPDALLVDVMCGEELLAGPLAVNALAGDGPVPPTIFLSARTDFGARLEAVRAGGDGYISKPVDVAALVGRLDQLTGRERAEPYRVLVVDDDALLAAQYEAALTQAGMQAQALTEPEQVIPAIRAFNPDLLVTDLHMPRCTGLELAAVLRQHEGLLSLPILFLTADRQGDKRRQALDLGADDMLAKPISLPVLVEQVRARAARSRQLRSLMMRDSLTGALNHGMVLEQLSLEVARSRREGTPLAFAMLDIDHFKKVNDTHGHAMGDRVLTSLSRLLQQRLRRTDIVGRYGGEEFALVLPRTDAATAAERIDLIRRDFGLLSWRGAEGPFGSSFSAGVAELGPQGDPRTLALAADQALYAAKRGGRDRVVVG